MSYNDLSSIKTINGIPVDLNFYSKAIENDVFFKALSDADEDMAALDRDIIPTTTNTYKLGSTTKYFLSSYIKTLNSEVLNLLGGSIASPSFLLGTIGLASANSGELSVVSSNLEALKISSVGTKVKAANNFQLAIENTSLDFPALWYAGCDSSGFRIGNGVDSSSTKLSVGTTITESLNKIKLPVGTALAPSLFFTGDNLTGFYKTALAELGLTINGNDALKVDALKVAVKSPLLVVPQGTSTTPSISFNGFENTGISGKTLTEIAFIFNSIQSVAFNNTGYTFNVQDNAAYNHIVASNSLGNSFNITRARGTLSSLSPALTGDVIAEYKFLGQGATLANPAASISVQAEEDFTDTASKGSIYLNTAYSGTNTLVTQLTIGQGSKADVYVNSGFGLNKITHSTPGTALELDVRHISKICVDTTSGNVEFKGFSGGKEGQMLYIYKKVSSNTLSILFNNAGATQKVLLKGSSAYTNTNDYGGITLSFDDGIWREVSRS